MNHENLLAEGVSGFDAGLNIVWRLVRPRIRDYAVNAQRQALVAQKLVPEG
jgi:hypothetical protein